MRKEHMHMPTAIFNQMNLKLENGGDLQNIFLVLLLTAAFCLGEIGI